ncbi:MAG: hypothetical protein Q9157_004029 [Trypethelium eluteriae]
MPAMAELVRWELGGGGGVVEVDGWAVAAVTPGLEVPEGVPWGAEPGTMGAPVELPEGLVEENEDVVEEELREEVEDVKMEDTELEVDEDDVLETEDDVLEVGEDDVREDVEVELGRRGVEETPGVERTLVEFDEVLEVLEPGLEELVLGRLVGLCVVDSFEVVSEVEDRPKVDVPIEDEVLEVLVELRVDRPVLLPVVVPLVVLLELLVDSDDVRLDRLDAEDDKVVGRPALLRLTIGGIVVTSGGCDVTNDGSAVTREGNVAAANEAEIAANSEEPSMVGTWEEIAVPCRSGEEEAKELTPDPDDLEVACCSTFLTLELLPELGELTADDVAVDEADGSDDATFDADERFVAEADVTVGDTSVVLADAAG